MIAWLRRLYRRVFGTRSAASLPPDDQAIEVVAPVNEATAPPVAEPTASYVHIGDILDRLDDYFHWMRKLRFAAPDFYDLYSRIGGVVLPENALLLINKPRISGGPADWPAFMASSFPEHEEGDEQERIYAKLVCFRKIKSGAYVQGGSLTAYEGLLLYTTRKEKLRYPMTFYVGVGDDGSVVPLRMPVTVKQHVRGRRGGSTINHRRVQYPSGLMSVAKERGMTAKEWASQTFYATLSAAIDAEKGGQVMAEKMGVTARFSVPLDRLPYFFRDREYRSGSRRAKIFHYVGEHERRIAKGVTTVRAHYRGARRFVWNGYSIAITVPDFHHPSLSRFGATSWDEDQAPNEETLDSREAGTFFRNHMRDAPDRRLTRKH